MACPAAAWSPLASLDLVIIMLNIMIIIVIEIITVKCHHLVKATGLYLPDDQLWLRMLIDNNADADDDNADADW